MKRIAEPLLHSIIAIFVFSAAMAFLESAVVVYLRAMFYPEGFAFPMKDIGNHLAGTEVIREFATVIMLISVSYLAGKNAIQRFAYFIISFALWDIFYYVFLKLLIDWPLSLLEWDVLFLLPVTWTGPVIAPLICSSLMILLGLLILISSNRSIKKYPGKIEWILLISGSVIVITSYTLDYILFLHENYSWFDVLIFSWLSDATRLSLQYIPDRFNWSIFLTGIVLITTGILVYTFKIRRKQTD